MSVLKQKTKEGVKPISVVNVIDDTNLVHKDTSETVTGEKTFTASPLVPTVADTSDNSTKAASTAFVQGAVSANDANLVHKTGTEQIDGLKVFTRGINYDSKYWLNLQNSELDQATEETGRYGFVTLVSDKNGVENTAIFSEVNKNVTSLVLRTGAGSDQAILAVRSVIGGAKVGVAPTPPASSNTNEVATTEWVRSKIKSGTTDPGVGSNLESGAIYFVYE